MFFLQGLAWLRLGGPLWRRLFLGSPWAAPALSSAGGRGRPLAWVLRAWPGFGRAFLLPRSLHLPSGSNALGGPPPRRARPWLWPGRSSRASPGLASAGRGCSGAGRLVFRLLFSKIFKRIRKAPSSEGSVESLLLVLNRILCEGGRLRSSFDLWKS